VIREGNRASTRRSAAPQRRSPGLATCPPVLLARVLFLALCHCVTLQAAPAPVVVIEGDFLGDGGASMRPQMQAYTKTMLAALDAADVPYSKTRDSAVERSGVPAAKVAVLPYNRAISAKELASLQAFIKGGGKIVVCFLAPTELLHAIGVQPGEVAICPKGAEFGGIRPDAEVLPGAPQTVRQSSDRIRACRPVGSGRIAGTWLDKSQRPTDRPAIVLSETGAFLSHVLMANGDRAAQGALMRALCGYFAPEVLRGAIPTSPGEVRPLGSYDSLAHLIECLQARSGAGEDVSRATAAVHEAVAKLQEAGAALARGDLAAANAAGAEARRRAQTAYWISYPSVTHELRGVWACNDVPPNWETAMRTLREANLNAVFPYMCTAGVAWYPSKHLPRESGRDYLQMATEAGQRWGVPVHARMLNLYAMCIPASQRSKYQKEGRLMVSSSGKTTNWLCAVNPANRKLQVDLAVEMATQYPVAGIHLDYMRYPGESYCFCPHCKKDFARYVGRAVPNMAVAVKSGETRKQFLSWRREVLTGLVREIRLALRQARPDMPLSAATFLNWEDHRDGFAQDWKVWVDRGLVDFVCPMSYTPDNTRFSSYVSRQKGWVNGAVPLCPGIGVNADNMTFGGPQNLLEQITITRNMDTQGWVVFNYDARFVSQYLPFLRLGATSTPAEFDPFWSAPKP